MTSLSEKVDRAIGVVDAVASLASAPAQSPGIRHHALAHHRRGHASILARRTDFPTHGFSSRSARSANSAVKFLNSVERGRDGSQGSALVRWRVRRPHRPLQLLDRPFRTDLSFQRLNSPLNAWKQRKHSEIRDAPTSALTHSRSGRAARREQL